MAKKITAYILIAVMFLMPVGAFADPAAEVAEQQAALDAINQQREELAAEISSGKAVVNSLNKEINELENRIVLTQSEINALSGSINLIQAKIDLALAEMEELEQEISEQNEALNGRLRTMYKNGSVGFLDVLLGSKGITELMTNLDRIQRIYDSDKEVLETLEVQRKMIDAQKEYLLGLQDDLELTKETEAQKKSELASDQDLIAGKKAEAEDDLDALFEMEDRLLAEANALTAEILKLQLGGDYIGGIMMWPTPGVTRITSPYGNRLHPIAKVYRMHTGIDIGASWGTSVVAANAGTVIVSKWNNSYGYYIVIDHGGGISTLYAHNSSLLVNVGDVVSMGQVISKVGSTGASTGPHLHFEVRINGAHTDPMSYVTPN